MAGRRSILIAAAALLVAGLAAVPAMACGYAGTTTCIGSKAECEPTPARKRAAEKQRSADQTRIRLAEAMDRLRSGSADPAAELSELLAPNVRPVWIETDSCGRSGEIDHAEDRPSEESEFQAIVAGTPFAGADKAEFRNILVDLSYSFGPPCNAEFRAGFAAFLRKSLSPSDLRQAWLFLSARKRDHDYYGFDLYPRLVTFDRRTRAPPVHWFLADPWLSDQVNGAVRRTAWGRSLDSATSAFWAQRAGGLGSDAETCPAAAAEWEATRQLILARMAAQRRTRSRNTTP